MAVTAAMVVTSAMTNQVMAHLAVFTATMVVTAAMAVTMTMKNQVMSHLAVVTVKQLWQLQ